MANNPNVSAPNRRGRGVSVPLMLILGAATAGVGAALDWLALSGGTIGIPGGSVPAALKGYEFTVGIGALIAAGVALFLGLLWLAVARASALVAALSVLAGAVIAAAAGYVLLDPEARFVETAAEVAGNQETTATELLDLLPRFFAANDVTVDVEVGLWVTLAGGAVVLLAGIAAIATSRNMSR